MRKKLFIILIPILIVSFFIACDGFFYECIYKNGVGMVENRNKSNKKTYVISDELKKENNLWVKKTKSLDHSYFKRETAYTSIPSTMVDFINNNESIIKGTIMGLEETTGAKNTAITKVSIKVENVISGDDHLLKRIVKVPFTGGSVKIKDLFFGMEEKAEKNGYPFDKMKNHKIFIEDINNPLPQIGSLIITGISRDTFNHMNKEYDHYIKINKLNDEDSFRISNPDYNFWIKNNGGKDYINNNKEVSKVKDEKLLLDKNDTRFRINEMTRELNNDY